MPALKASEEIIDGVRWLTCHYCGYRWSPRVKYPRQCPSCKRHIYLSDEMEDKQREKVLKRFPKIADVREVVPDIFTPQCVICGADATVQYKKLFYCGRCVMDKMERDGVIEE